MMNTLTLRILHQGIDPSLITFYNSLIMALYLFNLLEHSTLNLRGGHLSIPVGGWVKIEESDLPSAQDCIDRKWARKEERDTPPASFIPSTTLAFISEEQEEAQSLDESDLLKALGKTVESTVELTVEPVVDASSQSSDSVAGASEHAEDLETPATKKTQKKKAV